MPDQHRIIIINRLMTRMREIWVSAVAAVRRAVG